ncbi:putative membrane protein [Wickerhamomyces ciferrii]|uniref:Membrane protein n=1 Tax=Wickerhamomyces ciferrii (strain ATCC 14091 / BCRC 22168 / CBS 111 / JCM 3599 / NBRC 0793 / NRRL Y-1031 F-60-10) TaxID=1206466 RepID=K0KP67_WICCF|nr:uncharacterized protein BN7_3541 [Wickerhamomyces ciferrii]CCH43987.1 putative membrane protein [Wickerhamomyces ciferrii]
MNQLQAYLHSKVTTILSPAPSLQDTDYEIDEPSLSIHDKIISQRQAQKGCDYSNFTTPVKQRIKSPSSDYSNSSNSTIEIPPRNGFQNTPNHFKTKSANGNLELDDETLKIRQFVDIKQMLRSLRNLENLITEPNVDYEFFKKTYIESSYGLINSMNDTSGPVTQYQQNQKPQLQQNYQQQQKASTRLAQTSLPKEIESRDLIIKIGIVGVQILVVLIDLLTPICVQVISFGKTLLGNELVQKMLNVVVEIIWVTLSITLDYLKRFQHKTEQRRLSR